MAIPMLKIRRPLGRLIFNMGIATPGKAVFLIVSSNGLLPVWHQAVIWINDGFTSITPQATNFDEKFNKTDQFSLTQIAL